MYTATHQEITKGRLSTPYLLKVLACLDVAHPYFAKDYLYAKPKKEEEVQKVEIRGDILQGLPEMGTKAKRNSLHKHLVSKEERQLAAKRRL